MNKIDYKNDLWKLLLFQTFIYGVLFCIVYADNALTNNGNILWKPIITFYSISVLITFIISMIKKYKNK